LRATFILCLMCLLTSACSKVPSQSSYPYSYQHKVQSADHWERLSQKVVKKQAFPLIKKMKVPYNIYIQQQDRSDFGLAFNTFLTTGFHKKGVILSEKRNSDSITLEWSVQKVRHNSDRMNPSPVAGVFGYVGYLAMEFMGGDFYYPSSPIPKTEIIVSTKLLDNKNNILSIETETFYVDDSDTSNYWFIESNEKISSYVTKGSVVCKDKGSLSLALSETADHTTLSTLKALKDCAIMSKNHPVNIIDSYGSYLVIRSLDDAKTYVTSASSTSPI